MGVSVNSDRSAPRRARPQVASIPTGTNLAVARNPWPRQVFAPFVDVGLSAASGSYPQFDMTWAAQALGVKFFNLGFVTADQNGEPIFAGYRLHSRWDQGLRQQIAALRQAGGDVAICFGGANGAEMELARVIDDVRDLVAAYERIVEAYGVNRVNFAIEESAAADLESIFRRSQAIARLQQRLAARGRPLQVWLSVAALPTGLAPCALNVVKSAYGAGVDVEGVNVMAMNFGEAAVVNPEGRMGRYAMQSAESCCAQLCDIHDPHHAAHDPALVWARLGITPMVGQNDTLSERFYPQDAQKLLTFAEEKSVGMLSMWSINRDASTGIANYDSTGIAQEPYEFTTILASYAQLAAMRSS